MYKIVALGLLFVPSLALAAAADGSGPAASNTDKGSKMICREIDETGSRLGGKRVCMTRDQWEEQRRTARAAVERAQSGSANACSGAMHC
ncbi:MAG TPA: hypothetical protein VH331_13415 [Allosphingosinicella sp.]|jgi:hypothetical protein|nr:hypothetical protein [Allosphingosinicella sp.]